MSKINYDKMNRTRNVYDRGYSPRSYSRIKVEFATVKQKELMVKLGIDFGRLISKRDASDLISKRLDRK